MGVLLLGGETMIEVLIGIGCFFLGYIVAITQGGIHIHNHGQFDELPVEYNESMLEHLDPEIRRYYEQNNGQNKF